MKLLSDGYNILKPMEFLKIILLMIFISSFSFVLQAKSGVDNLSLKQLTVEDGLSQGTVNSILADQKGYIWLATDNGINIYDGYSIKQLPGPNNSFLDASIYFIKQDSEGSIWINANDALYRYQPETNIYQLILANSPDNDGYYVVDVTEGKNSENKVGFWITTNKTIAFYDPETSKLQSKIDLSTDLLNKDNIFQIKYHRQVLYIATRVGIYAYQTQKKVWKKLPSLTTPHSSNQLNLHEASKTFALYISEGNDLYFGTNDGVFSVNINHINEYISGLLPLDPYKLILENLSVWKFLYADEKLYVASNLGLHAIDTSSQHGEFLFGVSDYFGNISDNLIISLAQDNSGIFWLGSESKGAYLWDPSSELIKNYRYQKDNVHSLSHNAVWTVKQDSQSDDLLWVGTSNGLNLINHQQQSVDRHIIASSIDSQFSDNNIYQVYNYNDELLLLTATGVVFYNAKLNQVTTPEFDVDISQALAKEISSIFLQNERYLWLVHNDGVALIDLTLGQLVDLASLNKAVPLTKIYHILDSLPNSNATLFSTNDSLWSYDLATHEVIKLYQHPGILASEWIAFDNWAIDKKNILWLTFPTKGLVGLELQTFKAKYFYHSSNSIIDNNVYSLLTDTDGDIWFSTHQGIFLLNSDTHHIRNFTVTDGFPAMEFNAASGLKLTNGNFAYGSMEGISVFDPLKLKKKHTGNDFQVHVTNIDVLSRELNLPLIINQQQEIKLHYNDVGISFDFSTLFYGENHNVTFEYQLSGDSQINFPATTNNKVTFSSLSSGKHTLSVKAKSPITGEYSAANQINIQVSYAPWQSPLAYLIYIVVFLLFITFWFYQRHLKRLQLMKAHEEVIFRENRLQLALIGSNSEAWDWQAHKNLMFGKRIAQELNYEALAAAYSFEQHVELIHPDDKERFLSRWDYFIAKSNSDETFSCTYRLQHAAGNWLWYKDLGKIVTLGEDSKPSRITGSYTNITQTRAEEVRSQYYGEAFKQTNDWVLIVNHDFTRATANQSLRNAFGWSDEEFALNSNLLGLSRRRWQFFLQFIPSLEEGEHWRGEELVSTQAGKEFHVIVNINVGRSHTTNHLHYICVFSDISAQKIAEKELRYLANYDHLTNLPNRSLLLSRIKLAVDASQRHSQEVALFFIDLDRFKQVNDSLGHDCGDLLLVEVSRRLSGLLRVGDTISRIGGDEFVVLLENYKGRKYLAHMAQKIIEAVELPVLLKEHQVSIGASIGIAIYPTDASDSSTLLRHADVAMYYAKQLGRNVFQFFTPRMNFEASERLKKDSNVKLAHTNNEFFNHYQPIIDADNSKAVGFELLMRWQSKQGLIAPAGFISVAEELGLIIPMTEAALERGLLDLKKWHQLRPTLYLSVNLSPQHFAKENLVDYIASLLKSHELPAHLLKIEVTESALFSEPEQAIKTMKALSSLGVILALDDFGTGFSSLSYLKRLPLDIIKIDRTFISGIGIEKTDEAIVDATIVLAKRLNMYCIAEGVETTEQLNYLTQRHCHFIQGYIYSKPVEAKIIGDFLLANTV